MPPPPFNSSQNDTDLENSYEWFKNFISDADWANRKNDIETYLRTAPTANNAKPTPINEGTLLAFKKDQIAWYFYLLHTYLFEHHKYEYHQGARIIPTFKRIGADLELVKKIVGIEKKMKALFKKRRSEADAILFEVLTALLWARNGWDVTILEEGKGGKSPDFEVVKGTEKWQIECKRQMKTATYTYRESEKRQIMVSKITELLLQHNVLLNITFHVELEKLPDTYLFDLLKPIIPITTTPSKIVSNTEVDIDLTFIDIKSIQNHVKQYYIKDNSPQLIKLITKKHVDNSAFTYGYTGSNYFAGSGEVNNLYVGEVVNAYGVHSSCDSKEAIMAKARDVKNQIHSAISQFNPNENSIIHIGMETYDGPEVEKKRNEKITETMANIDPNGHTLCWIFFHYFQSYTRTDRDWYFDETVQIASSYINPITPPITHTFLIVPENKVSIEDTNHWDKELPM